MRLFGVAFIQAGNGVPYTGAPAPAPNLPETTFQVKILLSGRDVFVSVARLKPGVYKGSIDEISYEEFGAITLTDAAQEINRGDLAHTIDLLEQAKKRLALVNLSDQLEARLNDLNYRLGPFTTDNTGESRLVLHYEQAIENLKKKIAEEEAKLEAVHTLAGLGGVREKKP